MQTIRDKALKQCKLYAEAVLHDPELIHRLCGKIWAFVDIDILKFDEAIHFINQIIDNAVAVKRRNKRNACD